MGRAGRFVSRSGGLTVNVKVRDARLRASLAMTREELERRETVDWGGGWLRVAMEGEGGWC